MNPNDIRPDPPERDLCDELLAPPKPPADLAPLRERVWRRIRRRLRWRRHLRRAAFAAALAACWAGGMLTMRWWSPSAAPAVSVVKNQEPPVEPPPKTVPETRIEPPALAVEWKAFDSNERQAELYRTAADLYQQEHDPLSAVRCYGRSLDAAPEQTQTIAAGDDWLLMAIKDARKKEKRDAKAVD
jgi:hypothetical protein